MKTTHLCLAILATCSTLLADVLPRKLAIGDRGTSFGGVAKCVRVIGPAEMIAEVYSSEEQMVTNGTRMVAVGRSNRPKRVPVIETKWVPVPFTVWLKGVPTANLADESEVKVDRELAVTGTKSFTEKGETRTLLVVEPVGR